MVQQDHDLCDASGRKHFCSMAAVLGVSAAPHMAHKTVQAPASMKSSPTASLKVGLEERLVQCESSKISR